MNFFRFLFTTHRAKTVFWLAASVFICFGLVAARAEIRGTLAFGFLVWNLFLAFIPYAVSILLAWVAAKNRNRWFIAAGAAIWLLFFPNAPYILTDLLHLKPRMGIPYWYDILLIFSFAWTGLMLGYVSLAEMQEIIIKTYTKITGWLFVIVSLLLAGFGIYLGRFERWNSWDIVANPYNLATHIARPVLNPTEHYKAWLVTFAFGLFLIIGYFTIRQLGKMTARNV